MLHYGRQLPDATGYHPLRWDERNHVDERLARPEEALASFWQAVGAAASTVGERLGLGLSVTEAMVTEEQHGEALARSGKHTLTFGLTRLTVRLLVEVRWSGRTARLHANAYGNRLDRFRLEDVLTEAAFRGGSLLAPESGSTGCGTPAQPLLFVPRASAALLRVLTNDLFDRPQARPPDTESHHVLLDDPHADGGLHARPFDHEGTATGRTTIMGSNGRPGRLLVRGSRAAGPVLTGNAYSSVGFGAPVPRPTNVRLAGAAGEADDIGPRPQDLTGLLAFNLRGEGTQQIRTGEIVRFRVETLRLRGGELLGRGPGLFVGATAPGIVAVVSTVSAPSYHLPWSDHSTAAAWTLLEEPGGVLSAP
jgi:hypothetical protein